MSGRLPKAAAGVLRRFAADLSGSMTVFALMFLIMMIMMGGLAVDLMRYEARRTALQNTLDRSTLAAAALGQNRDARAVVSDYFRKAGLAENLRSVTVTQSFNSRLVTATAVSDTKPIFLHMVGINEMDANGLATAKETIGNVEIILALDISGSMSGTKLANLKVAAKAFVDTLTAGDVLHHVSIGIVPYNAQVNLGPTLAAKYNVVRLNGVANVDCLKLPTGTPMNVFPLTTLDQTMALSQMAHADVTTTTTKTAAYLAPTGGAPDFTTAFCLQNTNNIVRLPSDDAAQLKSNIDGLTAGGNTSIVLGMKWASTLLDPSMRPTYAQFISAGAMSPDLADRPYDYENTALKVVVLMTDGDHVAHEYITDSYKVGPSPIWKSAGDGNYSVQHLTGRPAAAGTNTYWVPHLGTWQATPWDSGAGVAQQNWENIWANLQASYVAWQFYARALGTTTTTMNSTYTTQRAAMVQTWASAAQMDGLLQQNCSAAKAQSVIIYGIAFQASAAGQTQIQNCSTDAVSGSHYFNATTLNISTAFAAIANNISQLRLTQ